MIKIAKVEEEKAKVRLSEAGKIGANITNVKLGRGVGREPTPRLEEKGKAIVIATQKARDQGLKISDKTVKKAKKILQHAEKDLEIKRQIRRDSQESCGRN